ATMILSGALLVATVALAYVIPKGFLPNEDIGQILIFTESAQGTSFESMVKHQRALAKIMSDDPNFVNYISSVDNRFGGAPNVGRFFARMKPLGQRPSADAVVEELRPKLNSLPGIAAYPQTLPTIRIGGTLTKSPYQYTLQGSDTNELYAYAPKLE